MLAIYQYTDLWCYCAHMYVYVYHSVAYREHKTQTFLDK